MMAARFPRATLARAMPKTFATSTPRPSFARLIICGNLVESPKKSATKTGKTYWRYQIATNDRGGPPNADGNRTSSFHNVISYQGTDKEYLGTLPKGTLVHVEASYQRKSEKKSDDTYSENTFLTLERLDILKKTQSESAEGEHAE